MIKLRIQRGDNLRKITAIFIMIIALIGGSFLYYKISKSNKKELVTITFDIDGTIIEKEILRGSSVEAPAVPIKTGYTFIGWDNEANMDIITKNETYRALYERNHYTITFDTNSELTIDPITYEFEEEIEDFIIPVKDGYEFVGWYYQGVEFNSQTMPAYNIELKGVWYSTITFMNVDGISFDELKAIPNEKITAPVVPEYEQREGEKIVWYKDYLFQEVFTFNRMPEENIKLYGRFEKVYTLDEGFLDEGWNNQLSTVINNYEDLVNYFEYIVFHKITEEIVLELNYEIDNIAILLTRISDELLLDTEYSYTRLRRGNKLYLKFEFSEEATTKASLTDLYQQLENYEDIIDNGRIQDFDDFYINNITKTYKVVNSEQLYYVVERGYRPLFDDNSEVLKIYNEAKYILRKIITNDMTDYEKIHAIYDWLIINITYDKRLKDYVSDNVPDIRKYRGLYLEGVFLDGRAVCDGIAKAFVLLCRIEGIEAIRVEGEAIDGSYLHAWNKVRLDNIWYVVDVTSGGTIVENKEIINHNYLLTNDDFYGSKFVAITHTEIIAYGEYDIYQEMFFEFDGYLYDFNITSQDELNIIVQWYTTNFDEEKTLDIRINFDYGDSLVNALIEAVNKSGIQSLTPIGNGDGTYLENQVLLIKSFTK